MFIIIIFVILLLMTVALGLQFYFNVLKSLCKHWRICNIVKEQSYLVDKETLISFEEEELQRQKTEKRNNKGKKKIGKDKEKDNEKDKEKGNNGAN